MSYTFSVTINGTTYTEADFVGMAYLQGVPDTLDSLAQAALAGNSTSTSTAFTPGSSGVRTVVLADAHIWFPTGSVVALRCSGGCLQIGRVRSWTPSTRTLVFDAKYYAPSGTPTAPWAVFPSTGPAGEGLLDGSLSWTERPRTIDEGGYGGPNGLVQAFHAREGYRSEGASIPHPRNRYDRNYHRNGWRVQRSSWENAGPMVYGMQLHGGEFYNATRQTPLRTSGKGIIHVDWFNGLNEAGSTLKGVSEIILSGRDASYHAGLYIQHDGEVAHYFVTSTKEGLTRRRHLFSGIGTGPDTGHVTFILGGAGDTPLIRIYVGSPGSPGVPAYPQDYMTPDMTLEVPDTMVSMIVRGKGEAGYAGFSSVFNVLNYSITEPLRMR